MNTTDVADAAVVEPDPAHVDVRLRWRIRRIVITLAIVALSFNNTPGKVIRDTKLDLTADPWEFLGRSLHLWDRQGFAGQLQDQAFGYLFPMGPFFGIGHSLGLPPWVVGRLWWAVVLCVAFWGMMLLIERLLDVTPLAATLGGLAYAFSPHMLTVLGPVSSEIWPMAVAPFVLLPLLRPPSESPPRRAAARSAVAVLCMGAVNATSTFAAVLPAALWLVTRRLTKQSVSLTAWWVVLVGAACVWWIVPLLVLGQYSPPFLDYIENAAIVTSTTSLFETLRGTNDWIAFLPVSGWTAGELLLTQGTAVVCTGLLVIAGMVGLSRVDVPHRRFLVGLLMIGVAISCAGFVGSIDGPWPEDVRDWLDGPLAPLRNVHKFDLLLRIPLCIGLAAAISALSKPSAAREQRAASRLSLVAVGVVIAAAAAPAVVLQLAPNGGYGGLPDHWRATAAWLEKNAPNDRALIVPGARFGYFTWGRSKDEPLQPLAESPWTVRDAVPMVPAGNIRMLDAVQELFDASKPSPALASYLNENGIDYLVVRNDLDYAALGAPRPAQVHATLLGSPGIVRVAEFGRKIGSLGGWEYAVDQGLQQSYPAVEIFRVGKPANHPGVRLLPQDQILQVRGGSESGLHVATGDGPMPTTVLSGDLAASGDAIKPNGLVVTDSLRRRDVNFGRNDNAASQTLTATAPRRVPKTVGDYLPSWASGQQTVVTYQGINDVNASTSAADATASIRSVPGDQPYAALDRDDATAWRTAPLTNPLGQVLQVNLAQPTVVPFIDLRFVGPGLVKEVEVDTDLSHQVVRIDDPAGLTRVRLARPTDAIVQLTVRISSVESEGIETAQVGISTLDMAGVQPQRFLRVPPTRGSTPVDQFNFAAGPDRSNGCLMLVALPLCTSNLPREGEDSAGIFRQFTVPTTETYELGAVAVPRPSLALDALLAKTIDAPTRIAVSSRVVRDPLAGPLSLTDRDPRTSWVADPTDLAPRMTFVFDGERTISRLSLQLPPAYAATWPSAVTVATGKKQQTVKINDPNNVRISPMQGTRFTVTLRAPALRVSWNPDGGFPEQLGLGLAGIQFGGVTTSSRATTDRLKVTTECGDTPDLVVGRTVFRTQATATVKDLRELRPVPLDVCSRRDSQRLTPGQHQLRAASSEVWAVQSVTLTADDLPDVAAAPTASERPTVRSWQPTSGRVDVPARAKPSVLIVDENTNPGWRATLAGQTLKPVTIGGWQQGYALPAGAAGTVALTFQPDVPYRAGLAVGLVLALLVVQAAVWPRRKREVVDDPAFGLSHPRWAMLGLAAVSVASLLLVGGRFGVVMAVIGCLIAWRKRDEENASAMARTFSGIGALAMLAATIGVATGPAFSGHYRAPDGWVQFCCLIALTCLAGAALVRTPVAATDPDKVPEPEAP